MYMRMCDTCRWFGSQLDHGQEVETVDDGACHRFPPSNMMLNGAEWATLLPSVNREDWCGEWAERAAWMDEVVKR